MTSPEPLLDLVMAQPGRGTRAIIDLSAITGNVAAVCAHVGPTRLVRAVVKADGYGHGAIPIARTALDAGASSLAVATVGELAHLRSAGIGASILILGPIDPTEIDRALALDVELTIGDPAFARALDRRATSLGVRVRVHAKVDTGMHRFGAAPDDLAGLIGAVDEAESLDLVGVEMHHAMSDDPGSSLAQQHAETFAALLSALRLDQRVGLDLHHANSGAALTSLEPRIGSVRLGIALYGLKPGSDEKLLPGMRPAMSIVSRISRLHSIKAGDGVSYGHAYHATGPERIGLVPIGYADGYRRGFSNTAWMGIGSKRAPVRGRVCMDQTVIGDLGPDVMLGDVVSIAGPIGGGPSFDELAALAGTINYEIATGISQRVPRYYIRNGQIVGTLIEGVLNGFGG